MQNGLKSRKKAFLIFFPLLISSCSHSPSTLLKEPDLSVPRPEEKYFQSIRQLTFGGMNTRAHWSPDGKWLVFQHSGPGFFNEVTECDRIYKIKADGSEVQRLSDGKGVAIFPVYFPTGNRVGFSSTAATHPSCPKKSHFKNKQVRSLDNSFQIFGIKPDGSDTIPLDPGAPRAYNAEAVACNDGKVIYTSDRDGDPQLYLGALDSMGTFQTVKKLTSGTGYHGEAVFSSDCKKIAWSASQVQKRRENRLHHKFRVKKELGYKPMEIWISGADGLNAHPITSLGALSSAPTLTANGKQIYFASNTSDPKKEKFGVYRINLNGTGLVPVTSPKTKDHFPSVSPDGNSIVFSSSRSANDPGEMNLFIAEIHPIQEQSVEKPKTLSE